MTKKKHQECSSREDSVRRGACRPRREAWRRAALWSLHLGLPAARAAGTAERTKMLME